MQEIEAQISAVVARMRGQDEDERAPLLEELVALCKGPKAEAARSHLEVVARGEVLEIQWELEEVLEATEPPKKEAPKAAPESNATRPESELEPDDPNRTLTARDLDVVYDDPRGLVLHRTKDGKRWFATQVDPRTRQPQTFELHPQEIEQIKAQLAGSPYWVLGSGLT